MKDKFIDIVFDGPPSHISGRFVEVEDQDGRSVGIGQWVHRKDGYWALRFPKPVEDPNHERIVLGLVLGACFIAPVVITIAIKVAEWILSW